MAYTGTRSVHFIRDKMRARQYTWILSQHLIKDGRRLCGKDFLFESDNDPKHTARHTEDFLVGLQVPILKIPSNSPDVSPIENLYAILKQNFAKKRYFTLEELQKATVKEWANIESNITEQLISSMPDRIQVIITNKGGYTKY